MTPRYRTAFSVPSGFVAVVAQPIAPSPPRVETPYLEIERATLPSERGRREIRAESAVGGAAA